MTVEVITAVKSTIVVLWAVTLCKLVGGYQHFVERVASMFMAEVTPNSEDGGDMLVRNITTFKTTWDHGLEDDSRSIVYQFR
jgi:hypothetical protein